MLHLASLLHSLIWWCALFMGGWNCLDPHQKLGKKGKNDQISPQKISFNPHLYCLDQSYCTPTVILSLLKKKKKENQKNPQTYRVTI